MKLKEDSEGKLPYIYAFNKNYPNFLPVFFSPLLSTLSHWQKQVTDNVEPIPTPFTKTQKIQIQL